MTPKEFLNELYEQKEDAAFMTIWELPLKRTAWFQTIDKAAEHIDELNNNKAQIYYGHALQKDNLGPNKRGSKENIIGIPGFYVDIDIKGELHQKQNLPPTLKDASDLVEGHGYDPTLIIFTGHGIHAHWIFKEPWMFENQKECEEAEAFNRRFQETIGARAAAKGWVIDATWDVTRILRVPGTWNRKDKLNPIKVECIKNSRIKYSDAASIEQFLLSDIGVQTYVPVTPKDVTKVLTGVHIDPLADPPTKLFDETCELDSKFAAAWQGKRKDLTDQSASGYTMSLASIAAHLGWQDQEIVDLIVAWYRRHGRDVQKDLHPKKLAITIAKVRQKASSEFVEEYEKIISASHGTKYQEDLDPGAINSKRFLLEELGLDVVAFFKYPQIPDPFYTLHVKTKKKLKVATGTKENPEHTIRWTVGIEEIKFKHVDEWRKAEPFKSRILAVLNLPITYSAKKWGTVIGALVAIMSEREVPEEMQSIEARMLSMFEEYLYRHKRLDAFEGSKDREPFVHNGAWHLWSEKFHGWAWQYKAITETKKEIQEDFVYLNCKQVKITIPNPKDDTKRTSIRMWRIPSSFLDPKDHPDAQPVKLDDYKASKNIEKDDVKKA